VLNAGVSQPSSTALLARRTAEQARDLLARDGLTAEIDWIDLGPLALDTTRSLLTGLVAPAVDEALRRLAAADAVVAATPVYKAGPSGLFTSFVNLVEDDLLLGTPVALVATGGTARHALVVDQLMVPLFAYLRALTAPTSLYAAPEDWGSPELGRRTTRTATELAVLVRAGVGAAVAEGTWSGHDHAFGGRATRAETTGDDLDFDTDLMRLAVGRAPRDRE
jgi:FMN reductase